MPNVLPATDSDPADMLQPAGHAIGFVETSTECDAAVKALEVAGYADSAMLILRGEEGQLILTRMMKGSLWGESAETVYKQGTDELNRGHSILCVQAQSTAEADRVSTIVQEHGVHSVYHFGLLSDTRLTQ